MSDKLNRLVGERVFGWFVNESEDGCPPNWATDCVTKLDKQYHAVPLSSGPHFDREIGAAWEVVEHLQRGGFRLRLMDQYDCIGMWDCRFYKYPESTLIDYKTSKTAPEAICLAALRAVGVPEAEIQEATR